MRLMKGRRLQGIADFDSLSATYGLMGIHRTGRMSPFYYGNRFRLTFPPAADVATVTAAYGNLSYIQSVEHKPPPETRAQKHPFDKENAGLRLLAKVATGTASGVAFTVIVAGAIANESMGGHFLGGAAIGCSVGFPIGVTAVDPYDSLPKTLLAGVIPGALGIGSVQFRNIQSSDIWFVLGMAYVAPVISSLYASEASRKPPQSRRVSFALAPTLNGGLSAVATLRF